MGCTVAELLDRVSSHELTEWEAYEHVSGPIGDERLDDRFAMLAATLANVNRGKSQKPYTVEDFLPPWAVEDAQRARRAAPPMSGEDMLRKVKGVHRAIAGDQRGGRGNRGDSR